MKRMFITLIVSLFISTSVIASGISCPGSYIDDWTGIDKVDGGEGHKRFWRGSDGFIHNIGNDSWHGPCEAGWPAKTFSDDLTCDGKDLVGTWDLDCLPPLPTAETGDRTFGVRYELLNNNKMRETLLNFDTGEPIDREPIVYTRGN